MTAMRRWPLLALLLTGCPAEWSDTTRIHAEPITAEELHPDVVHRPDPLGVWHAPLLDDAAPEGMPTQAACVTCHGPDPSNHASVRKGERFHANIEIEHDSLACDSCHDHDRTRLHTADGQTFDFSQVMRLCGQCHGHQKTDWDHGAHGGSSGYWDRRQGARVRKNCVDCHAPHAPAYPDAMPVFRHRTRGDHGGD